MQSIDSGVQPSAAPKPSVRTAGIAGADSFRIVRSLTIGMLSTLRVFVCGVACRNG